MNTDQPVIEIGLTIFISNKCLRVYFLSGISLDLVICFFTPVQFGLLRNSASQAPYSMSYIGSICVNFDELSDGS